MVTYVSLFRDWYHHFANVTQVVKNSIAPISSTENNQLNMGRREREREREKACYYSLKGHANLPQYDSSLVRGVREKINTIKKRNCSEGQS